MTDSLTIIDADGERTVAAQRRGSRWLVPAGGLAAATGWELKPEGLCRGPVCVPTRGRDDLLVDGMVDLGAFADALQRPLALDSDEAAAVLGDAAPDVGAAMASLDAPDFTLPTLDGTPFTFSAVGRKKKVLVTWASW